MITRQGLLSIAVLYLISFSAICIGTEIKLKNGNVFKGNIVLQNERVIVLEVNGARVNIFKNIIETIDGAAYSTAATQPIPSGTQAQPATPTFQPAPALPPLTTQALPGQTSETGTKVQAPEPKISDRVKFQTMNADQEENAPAIPETGKSGPAPISVQPSAIPASTAASAAASQSVTNSPMEKSADAVKQPVVTPSVSAPPVKTPASAAAPAVTVSPVVNQVPPAMQVSAAPVKPVKRSDGKTEIALKNGTVLIGTVISENERFMTFLCDGATINILKRVIKTIDNVPVDTIVPEGALKVPDAERLQKIATSVQSAPATGPSPAKPAVIAGPSKGIEPPKLVQRPGVTSQELVDSLSSRSWKERSSAASQLGVMGQWASSAVPQLALLLNDTAASALQFDSRFDTASGYLLPPGKEAARALSRMGNEGYERLTGALKSGNVTAKKNAAFGLGEVKVASSALGPLGAALKDQDAGVRAAAVKALCFQEALNLLITALDDADPDVRSGAAQSLGQLGRQEAVKPLVTALYDKHSKVRANAAEALGNIGGSQVIVPLSAAVQDGNMYVRENAARALGRTADTAAVTALVGALKDSYAPVRTAAARSLCSILDPRAIPSLYSLLKDDEIAVREEAEIALKMHTEIPQLIGALDNKHQIVRDNAAYVLWLMTGKDLGSDKVKWLAWYQQEQDKAKKASTSKAAVPGKTSPASGTPKDTRIKGKS